jgi:hypothetical protein
MARRNDEHDPSAPSIMAEENDADDPRTFEHGAAEAVRNGTLSAAQLPGGGGNVDPTNADAQYPPGRVETMATYPDADDLRSFVPERKGESDTSIASLRTTAATPDYDGGRGE